MANGSRLGGSEWHADIPSPSPARTPRWTRTNTGSRPEQGMEAYWAAQAPAAERGARHREEAAARPPSDSVCLRPFFRLCVGASAVIMSY